MSNRVRNSLPRKFKQMDRIKFMSVYSKTGLKRYNLLYLYQLLAERETWMNISHNEMPTLLSHINFVNSKPYKEWHFIIDQDSSEKVGCVYLTYKFEVGIQIRKPYKQMGYGQLALEKIISKYPKQAILANINPDNLPSRAFFQKMGFEPLQVTYKLDRAA